MSENDILMNRMRTEKLAEAVEREAFEADFEKCTNVLDKEEAICMDLFKRLVEAEEKQAKFLARINENLDKIRRA